MNVVIIDDERLARDELRRMLGAYPGVHIAAEAANVAQGMQAIARVAPDLIFLDIQMPDGSGFDLLAALDHVPAVVFTTAYDQYAIRAFDVSALDYLLKPIEPERLAQALDKAERARQLAHAVRMTRAAMERDNPASTAQAQAAGPEAQAQGSAPSASPQQLQLKQPAADGKVFIQDGERCWFVELEQIMLFESEGNYTRVYFDQHRPLLLRSLLQLEARLDANQFIRTSRSQIVNMRFVTNIGPSPAGGLTLTLEGDLKVAMSRRRSTLFKQINRL